VGSGGRHGAVELGAAADAGAGALALLFASAGDLERQQQQELGATPAWRTARPGGRRSPADGAAPTLPGGWSSSSTMFLAPPTSRPLPTTSISGAPL
jgi:hypothetical protein